ncbi:phosphopantetheine-binding protein [Streptomyces sp. TS71-3]|uniref:phosphopantetheine-binding protein n=1 Tax=Streptomyces sp. TS71-3 TaxID=2733862 RepID=UPI001B1E1EAF|nr:phosphopantetheine-binding protein [Streptomyces sp. TS71-3]GHJ41636.1 hypothetical protein Sm713_72450 [Streptomyces sp. TS71-3]
MQDGTYEQVLGIVRRVLRVDALDVRQDFFTLAATSLAVLQIVSLAQQECGVELSVVDAFDAPDIDSFARTVAGRAAPAGGTAT